MYKKKIPFDIDCGIKITMEVIGGKWKSCIIQELCTGPKRPSELHRLFTEASPRVINQQLPPHSEYAITELGKTLIPLIEQLEIWGDSFRPEMKRILKIE